MNQWTYRMAQLISGVHHKLPSNSASQYRRVLMYHSIVKPNNSYRTGSDIYSISETRFVEHVDILSRSDVVRLDDKTPNGVTITFDDGYADTLTVAAPLLCEKEMPFSVFIIPARIIEGNPNFLSCQDLKTLSNMPGVTIGCHGYSHFSLAELSREQIHSELVSSKNWLENVIEKPITTMSYPHGSYNSAVMEIAESVGYIFAATSNWGEFKVGVNQLQIPRIDIWSFDDAKALGQKLNGDWDWVGRFT